MTQALSGGAVALVLLLLWLLRRPRPQLMRSTDGASVAALNRVQMELVVTQPAAGPDPGQGAFHQPMASPAVASPGAAVPPAVPPFRPQGLRELNAQLAALKAGYALGGQARRQAMETCLVWGHRASLPLLQLGLRDADPVVASLAARGLDRFRGRSGASPAPAQPARLPRNVARTR